MRYNALVIDGPPGSGKDANSRLLKAEFPQLFPIGTGDMVRAWVKRGSALAQAYAPKLARRELLDDQQMFAVLTESLGYWLESEAFVPGTHLPLLNGYPRNMQQGNDVRHLFNIVDVLQLQCDDDSILVGRILADETRAGRTDNDVAAISRGITIYRTETAPMIRALGRSGVHVQKFNGACPLVNVAQDLSDYVSSHWESYFTKL